MKKPIKKGMIITMVAISVMSASSLTVMAARGYNFSRTGDGRVFLQSKATAGDFSTEPGEANSIWESQGTFIYDDGTNVVTIASEDFQTIGDELLAINTLLDGTVSDISDTDTAVSTVTADVLTLSKSYIIHIAKEMESTFGYFDSLNYNKVDTIADKAKCTSAITAMQASECTIDDCKTHISNLIAIEGDYATAKKDMIEDISIKKANSLFSAPDANTVKITPNNGLEVRP